jgi:hypothetical protein
MRVLSLHPAALVLSLMIAAAKTSYNYPTPPEPMDPQSHKTEQPQIDAPESRSCRSTYERNSTPTAEVS